MFVSSFLVSALIAFCIGIVCYVLKRAQRGPAQVIEVDMLPCVLCEETLVLPPHDMCAACIAYAEAQGNDGYEDSECSMCGAAYCEPCAEWCEPNATCHCGKEQVSCARCGMHHGMCLDCQVHEEHMAQEFMCDVPVDHAGNQLM